MGSMAPQSAFDEAFHIYVAKLQQKPKSKKLVFIESLRAADQKDGPGSIEGSVQKLQTKCDEQGVGTMTANILGPIVDTIKTYSTIVDVMVSANPMPAALIWGSFKVFVEVASSYLSLCELLQDELEILTDQIRRLVLYERLFIDYPNVQRALGRSYVSIIDFWYHASKWSRERIMRRARKILGAPATKAKIIKDLGQLNEDADRLEKVSKDAELDLQHKARSEESFHRQRQNSWTQHDAMYKRMQLQKWLKEWLGGNNEFNSKQYDRFLGKRHPGSCHWLLGDERFKNWWEGHLNPSILWLHGQPGAGKSVLCSTVIEQARKSPSDIATAFLFMKFARHVETLQLLRDLALQLLLQLFQRQGADQEIPESVYGILQADRDDTTDVKRFFGQLVDRLAPVYVFLDGLNEVEADIGDFLRYLTGLAANEKVRLWCSSQYHSRILVDLEGCSELIVTATDNQADIESYLSKTIPRHIRGEDPQIFATFQKTVLVDTKGCFLWASNMIEALATAMSQDEMKLLISGRLPATMDEYYAGLLKRLNERDKSGWGLLRNVLSLLAFARRPLRVSELREAIAILRRPLVDNLTSSALPMMSKVHEFCSPLIEVIDSSISTGDGQVQLSHSIVRDFLLKHSDAPQDVALDLSQSLSPPQSELYVTSRVIAECCLRYLLQRKYSHLLMKRTPSKFDVTSGYEITNHHLLLYAAEFWSGHYDDVEPTKQDYAQLEMFLKSLNFYTWIQLQSLYLNRGGREKFNRKANKHLLPRWYIGSPGIKDVESNYQEYVEEWSNLLCQGVSWGANGEIDRCFWGALGPKNSLSRARELERYTSFMFEGETQQTEARNLQYFHTSSSDGSQTIIASLDMDWTPDTSPGKGPLKIERWSLDGSNGPCVEQRHELRAQVLDHGLLYSRNDRQRFAIPPEAFSNYRPAGVAFSNDSHFMRVGGSLWYSRSSEISTSFEALSTDEGNTQSYWEEITNQGSIVAVARRRAPRQEKEHMGGQRTINVEETINDDEPGGNLFEDLDVDSHGSDSLEDEIKSIYSESNKEDDTLDEVVTFSDRDEESDLSDISFSSNSDPKADSEVEITFSDMGGDDQFDRASSTTRSISVYIADDSDMEPDPLDYARDGVHGSCNICTRDTLVHYHCEDCGQWDMCELCFDEGEWCRNKEHSLTKRFYWDQEDGEEVRYDDLALTQELIVLDTNASEPRQLYYFSRKTEDLMFESPPVIHPSEPLVVWLMSRDKLLFGNFGTRFSFIHGLPTSSSRWGTKTRRVMAKLRFSHCGRYLHIISFETPSRKRGPGDKAAQGADVRGGLQTSVCLLTYKLPDVEDYTGENPPTLTFSTRFSLSPLSQETFIELPFAVTWLPTVAFITVSDSELKIYRVRLFQKTRSLVQALPRRRTLMLNDSGNDVILERGNDSQAAKEEENAYVLVPKNTILLPESAKDRTVQYFPPNAEDRPNATIIIGSRSGQNPTPPIGVYFAERDLGGWINVAEARRAEMESLIQMVQQLGGKFEDLVPGEDIDLVRQKNQDGFLESAELGDTNFSVRFGQDLELTHGRNRVLMRRIDESDGRIMFKTPTGAGTAVVKANKEDELAKLNWYNDLSLPIEVYENADYA